MEIRRSFESFTENDFRISISHLRRLSVIGRYSLEREYLVIGSLWFLRQKNFDAQMASGSVKGTVGIKGDARCFIVNALLWTREDSLSLEDDTRRC